MYMENLEYIEDKSYRVAEPLLQGIKDMLKSLGMDSGHVDRWESLIYLVLILLLSLVITWLLRIVLHRVFVRLSRHTRNKTLQVMIKRRLFSSVAYIFFPLIVLAFLPWVYGDAPHLIRWIERICSIVFVGVFWFYINRTIDTFWHIFSQRDEWRDRPLKGIVQLLKGIFIGVAVILIAAIIAETLEAMRPAFVRWPGGCVVEGITLSNRIKWKETIGDPVTRPGVYDTWGYRTTMGFGYHEFLQFCEDIGAGGMFVCNVGLGCQGRVGDACKEDEVDSFIEDVLDAIDYALGDGTTEWSRKRVENGHPAPFPLKYVEIGNENWGPVYEKRYDKFYKAIKEKYPQLKLISTLGLGGQHRHERVDMIDPHWYVSPEFFFASDKLFDQQERGDYEIYIGEYAVNQNVGGGNLLGALAEAAFLTGVERNSDLVKMASYAPLFENVNDRVWPTNLIWFDSYRVMGRSSYQVQKMYAENRPSFNVATSFEQPVIPVGVKGQIAVGGWNTDNEYKDLKVTLADGRTVEADMSQGWTPQEGTWNAEGGTLKGSGPGVMRWNLWSVPEAFGDCSISLKARKIAGAEGFLIYFGMHDGKNGYVLNIGGWGNQTTAFQRINGNDMPQIPNNISQYVEEGRWYDIRIDIKDGKFTYSLDGKQMLETAIENIQRYVVSGYDENTGELIVKFVNATKEPFSTSVNLQNVTSVKRKGKVVTLTSADPKDENTLDDPKRVFPRESTFNKFSGQFDYTFEPWSFTVLRIKAEI